MRAATACEAWGATACSEMGRAMSASAHRADQLCADQRGGRAIGCESGNRTMALVRRSSYGVSHLGTGGEVPAQARSVGAPGIGPNGAADASRHPFVRPLAAIQRAAPAGEAGAVPLSVAYTDAMCASRTVSQRSNPL